MSLNLASSDSPSYFIPSSGAPPTMDYRGGLVRELMQAVHSVRKRYRTYCATVTSVIEHVEALSGSARVEEYAIQYAEIERLCAAPSNWSTMPVDAPGAAQIETARRGLIMLLFAGVPAPRVMLMNDGTFAASWRRDGLYASIDFDADGEFPWSAIGGVDVSSGTWSAGVLPSQLRAVITG